LKLKGLGRYKGKIGGLHLAKIKANEHHGLLFSTTRLHRNTQLTSGLPWHHEGPRVLIRVVRAPRKSKPVITG